jgi:hypothetical protein
MVGNSFGLRFASCSLQDARCEVQIALLLPVVYFVVEIASMC